MKNNIIVLWLLLLSIPSFAQKQKIKHDTLASSPIPLEIKVPFVAEKWEFQAGKVEFLEYKGLKAVRLNEHSGIMICKDLNFRNGTIEFDVEVSQALPFPAFYFHVQARNAEHVYLRTGTAANKSSFEAVQYASIINDINIWDLQHEFQSAANIKIGMWNHVKLVVSGKQLRVYINNPPAPNLEIPCMEGNAAEGSIAIGTGFPGQAVFANLVIRPGETEGLCPQAGADLTNHDTRYIRNWQVSKPDSLPYGSELNNFRLPKPDAVWEQINAERRGLVNLSRKFGGNGKRNYVWLKATIKSESAQTQIMKIGFSDEIWVFVNQKPVYPDKNLYLQNKRKSPNGRISLDNGEFEIQLVKGDNELLIGVANDFYGWGIMARLENMDGIEILP